MFVFLKPKKVLEVLKKQQTLENATNDATCVPLYEDELGFDFLADPSLVPVMPFDFEQIFLPNTK